VTNKQLAIREHVDEAGLPTTGNSHYGDDNVLCTYSHCQPQFSSSLHGLVLEHLRQLQRI
jgi:hypothetical protein